MKRLPRGVYFITPDTQAGRIECVTAALHGGARLVQYRDKAGTPQRRLEEAQAIRERCHAQGARLIINDDIELCLASDADGVHLGEDDAPVALAREKLGPDAILGASCYNDLERARLAIAEGADYVAFGSVFPSTTKPLARRVSLTQLREARRRFAIPICAIGGINVDNAASLVAIGVDLLAVVEAIASSPDPQAVTRRLVELFPPEVGVEGEARTRGHDGNGGSPR